MGALLKDWIQAAAATGNIPEDELADLDPAAYAAVQTRKALKKEQEAAVAEFEDRRIKVKAEEHERKKAALMEAALIRAAEWDHTMTEFGGRQMSQADEHDIRRYISDHRLELMDWGLKNGHFKTEAEAKGYFDRSDRIDELKQKEKTGTITEAEKVEVAAKEEQQRLFSPVDVHSAGVWQQKKASYEAIRSNPTSASPQTAVSSAAGASDDINPFRSKAPDMMGNFALRAGLAPVPQDQPVQGVVTPTPVTAKPLVMAGLS